MRKVLVQAVENSGASRQQLRDFSDALGRLFRVDVGLVVTALWYQRSSSERS